MVYISRDGTVHKEQPWGLDKFMSIIAGFVNMIVSYFQTMIPIEDSSRSGSRFRGSGGGGYSFGNQRPPRPPRPGGNIHGLGGRGAPAPPPACGSCCGM